MHFPLNSAVFAFLAGQVQCHLDKVGHSHNHMIVSRRADPTTIPSFTDWREVAKLKDEKQECTPYIYPGIQEIKPKFPTVWQTADIVSDDIEARKVFEQIQQSGIIPKDVQQKGSVANGKGDFGSIKTSYPKSDPDCWFDVSNCVTPKHPGLLPDVWQCPEPFSWGLSFDDGPNCTHNKFYDFLFKNKQKASLFYIGSNVMDWPAQGQRGVADGHHICVHTWSHPYLTQLNDSQVFAELYYTGKVIQAILGITVTCWRPPYGDVDDRVRAIAQGLGMQTILWSEDTDDWEIEPEGTKPESVINQNYVNIINKDYTTHGNIVLTHEIDAETMDEFIQQYPAIQKKFKHIVPITACMNQSNPYPADKVVFPDFTEYLAGKIDPKGYPNMSNFNISNSGYYPKPFTNKTDDLDSHHFPKGLFGASSPIINHKSSFSILFATMTIGFAFLLLA